MQQDRRRSNRSPWARACWGIVAWGCGLQSPTDPGALVPATVDDDPALPALDLGDTRVHLETHGDPDDPVVIALHGGPSGDHSYMMRLIEPLGGPALHEDYFWVFWDQRGSGQSRRHDPEDITFDAFLADLEALVDHFSPDRPVAFVGHSWGGAYATMYIDRHPDRVAGAVLLEPGPLNHALFERMPPRPDGNIAIASEWFNDWTWGRRWMTGRDHARADYQLALNLIPTAAEGDVDGLVPSTRIGAAVLLELAVRTIPVGPYDFTAGLADFAPEVLFIAGGDTPDLGVAFQEVQREAYPQTRLEIVEGAGHDDIIYWDADRDGPP